MFQISEWQPIVNHFVNEYGLRLNESELKEVVKVVNCLNSDWTAGTVSPFYPLFSCLSRKHDLQLLESELQEIVIVVNNLKLETNGESE